MIGAQFPGFVTAAVACIELRTYDTALQRMIGRHELDAFQAPNGRWYISRASLAAAKRRQRSEVARRQRQLTASGSDAA